MSDANFNSFLIHVPYYGCSFQRRDSLLLLFIISGKVSIFEVINEAHHNLMWHVAFTLLIKGNTSVY